MNEQSYLMTRRTAVSSLLLGAASQVVGQLPGSASTLPAASKLERSSPESVGIDPSGILSFVDTVEQKLGGLHSFMLLRHGKVAAEGWWEPYAPNYKHMLYSLSKSFASTAMGFAVADSKVSVEDPVLSFFPEFAPEKPSEHLAAMRVKHLLMMSTGHEKDATGPTSAAKDGNWVKAFLNLPVEHEPGSLFVYNSAATYMVSAIVQKKTGKTALDYLKPRLFDPLGISGATWESCPRGINKGGWGLSVKTEDIARFGQCYLQGGKFDGKQVIPAKWVDEATSKHISNGSGDTSDWAQGYGYQFWRCRHGAYRGDGAFGQFCVVLPEQDTVIAITSGLGDMQAVLNAAWDNLLPAIKPGVLAERNQQAFKKRLDELALKTPKGAATSPVAAKVSGKAFVLDANDQKAKSVTFKLEGSHVSALFQYEGGERKLEGGIGKWASGVAPFNGVAPFANQPAEKFAGQAAWTNDNTLVMTLCFVETPYIQTVTCAFDNDSVKVDVRENVGFGPTQRPALVGKAV